MSTTKFFAEASAFAVAWVIWHHRNANLAVGASADRSKFGNRVLLWYTANVLPRKQVIPVNPKAVEIENLPCVASLSALADPENTSVSVITPPAVTDAILREAARLKIKNVWLQPGSESPEAIEFAIKSGVNVIHGGECILVSGAAAQRGAASL
eukprot:jgi/Hompol1/6643/HPOL_000758-RA